MPYPNEHSGRLTSPGKYKEFRRENNKFGSGIHAIWGIITTPKRKAELQAIRFDKNKFTVAQAKAWLKDHNYKPILFEPASTQQKHRFVMQLHTRNNVSHVDFIFELGNKIFGWTIFDERKLSNLPGMNGQKFDVIEMQQLQKERLNASGEKQCGKITPIDKGWIEFGIQRKWSKEYFLHGKKFNGRWIIKKLALVNKNLSWKLWKTIDQTPYVLTERAQKAGYVPPVGTFNLPQGIIAKIPRELKWWERKLIGQKARDMINKVIQVRKRPLQEELSIFAQSLSKHSIENKIKRFLSTYKLRKHSINTIVVSHDHTWPKTAGFKLPLPIEGIALEEGKWRGMDGQVVEYSGGVISKAVPLLKGVQIRMEHEEHASDVVGWTVNSWGETSKQNKKRMMYKGLIFDYEAAKKVYNASLKGVSVGVINEELASNGIFKAKEIRSVEELSLTESPACKPCNAVVTSSH